MPTLTLLPWLSMVFGLIANPSIRPTITDEQMEKLAAFAKQHIDAELSPVSCDAPITEGDALDIQELNRMLGL